MVEVNTAHGLRFGQGDVTKGEDPIKQDFKGTPLKEKSWQSQEPGFPR